MSRGKWIVFTHEDIGRVAAPAEWQEPKHGWSTHLSEKEAKKQAHLVLDIGSARETLNCIESLFVAANQIYTLVDEGYLDSSLAILCFKERQDAA